MECGVARGRVGRTGWTVRADVIHACRRVQHAKHGFTASDADAAARHGGCAVIGMVRNGRRVQRANMVLPPPRRLAQPRLRQRHWERQIKVLCVHVLRADFAGFGLPNAERGLHDVANVGADAIALQVVVVAIRGDRGEVCPVVELGVVGHGLRVGHGAQHVRVANVAVPERVIERLQRLVALKEHVARGVCGLARAHRVRVHCFRQDDAVQVVFVVVHEIIARLAWQVRHAREKLQQTVGLIEAHDWPVGLRRRRGHRLRVRGIHNAGWVDKRACELAARLIVLERRRHAVVGQAVGGHGRASAGIGCKRILRRTAK